MCVFGNGGSLNLVLDICSHNGMNFIKWIEEGPYNFIYLVCSVTEKCVDGSLFIHLKKSFLVFSSLEK